VRQIAPNGAVPIDYIDTLALLDQAISNPGADGLTNTMQPAWTGHPAESNSGVLNATGSAQGGYLFFDGLHPTATGHSLLDDAGTQTLTGTA
jgi:phospholipase/lecithinase/hemolysin